MVVFDNMIALYSLQDIDHLALSQILQGHPEKITTLSVTNSAEITSDKFRLCISREDVADCTVPVLKLTSGRLRIGHVVDRIESVLLQNHYGDITYASYYLDWNRAELRYDNQTIPLTEREKYLIAEILMGGSNGQDRHYLLQKIWGYRSDLETHTLETHIYRLRQKMEDEPDSPQRLVTIENGYKII